MPDIRLLQNVLSTVRTQLTSCSRTSDRVERTAPRFTGLYAIVRGFVRVGCGCVLGNVALISLRSSQSTKTLNSRTPGPALSLSI